MNEQIVNLSFEVTDRIRRIEESIDLAERQSHERWKADKRYELYRHFYSEFTYARLERQPAPTLGDMSHIGIDILGLPSEDVRIVHKTLLSEFGLGEAENLERLKMEVETETKKLTFYGSSDDNFGYDVDGKGGDEIDCFEAIAAFRITDGDETMDIVGAYAMWPKCGAVWMVGVAQREEGENLPGWPIEITAEGYTTQLTVTVPVGAEVIPLAEGA